MDRIDTLIRDREAAPEGCPELDTDIYIALNPEIRKAGRIDRARGQIGWWPKNAPYESVREVPHYTTSLDAALPWENIVSVNRVNLRDGEGEFLGTAWVATHEDPETGEHTTGEAKTEPLSRRFAALKARRGA